MIIAPGATLQLISRDFAFTEGATVNRNGDLFFTDQPNNRIWKYATNGELSIFMENAGRSNGMCFDHQDDLIACADEKNELWHIAMNKEVTVLANAHEGLSFNGPNDIWCHPSGNIYFTDPYYQRPYWKGKPNRIPGEYIFLLSPQNHIPQPIVQDLQKPNGITGTADGRSLYAGDIDGKKTMKYPILPDGTLAKGEVFATMGSDGMTVDMQGNVYLTGDGVTVFDVTGTFICHIPVPEKWTANLAFGGKRRKTLFITATEGLYKLEMNVNG